MTTGILGLASVNMTGLVEIVSEEITLLVNGLEIDFTGLDTSGTTGPGAWERRNIDCSVRAFLLFFYFRRADSACWAASVVSTANSANPGRKAVTFIESALTETDLADSEVTGKLWVVTRKTEVKSADSEMAGTDVIVSGSTGTGAWERRNIDCSVRAFLLFFLFRRADTACWAASVASTANSANPGRKAVTFIKSALTETDLAGSEVTGKLWVVTGETEVKSADSKMAGTDVVVREEY